MLPGHLPRGETFPAWTDLSEPTTGDLRPTGGWNERLRELAPRQTRSSHSMAGETHHLFSGVLRHTVNRHSACPSATVA
jgi:hypothetical protein